MWRWGKGHVVKQEKDVRVCVCVGMRESEKE